MSMLIHPKFKNRTAPEATTCQVLSTSPQRRRPTPNRAGAIPLMNNVTNMAAQRIAHQVGAISSLHRSSDEQRGRPNDAPRTYLLAANTRPQALEAEVA
jgi:hypothetical protein